MSRPALRLALASSWRGGSKGVLAAVLQSLGAAAVVVVVLGALAAVAAEDRAHERRVANSFLPSTDIDTAAALSYPMIDEAPGSGDTISVTVLKPLDPTMTIPGIRTGEQGWFVSPALAHLVAADANLEARYPDARTLGIAGVGFADDLRAVKIVDTADGLELPISQTPNSAIPHLIDQRGLEVGLLSLIALPSLISLLGANTAMVRMLRPRISLLRKLGAPRQQLAALCALTVAVTAIPGFAAGSLGWWLLSRHLPALPLVGMGVFDGDLELSPIVYAAVWTIGLAMIAAITIARAVRAGTAGVISDQAPTEPKPSRWIPMCAGLALMAAAPLFSFRAQLFFSGLIALVIGILVSLPRALWLAGGEIARAGRRRPQALLAGRVLQSEARYAGGAYLSIAAIVVLAPFATIWVATAKDAPNEPAAPYWYRLPTSTPREEVEAIANEYDLAPMRLTAASTEPNGPLDQVFVIGDCKELPTLNGVPPCTPGATVLSPAGPAGIGTEGQLQNTQVRDTFLVAESTAAGDRLRAHFLNRTSPIGVPYLGLKQPSSPLEPWLIGGLKVAVGLALIGLALYSVGVGRQSTAVQARLALLGADTRLVRYVAVRLELAVGFATLILGTVSAVAVQLLFTRFDQGATVQLDVLALTTLAGAVTTVVIGTLAAAGRPEPTLLWSDATALNPI